MQGAQVKPDDPGGAVINELLQIRDKKIDSAYL